MASIKDVAQKAGVGVGTVSRVLNNSGYVSDETREKIEEAMKNLQYTPNELARNLYHKKSGIIAVLVPTAKPITILPVEERIPNVPVLPERNLQMPELTEEMKAARESWAKRWEEYKPAREEQFRIKENKARRESKLNTEFAKKLREEYK